MTAARKLVGVERALLRAWPSAEMVEVDGWILRASGGYTKRANSVNPHFGSTLPLQEKLDRCEAFYAERRLPTIFRLTPFSVPENLDDVLAERGYTTLDPTLVMTRPVRPPDEPKSGDVHDVGAEAWHAAFESLRRPSAERREHHRWIVDHADGERVHAVIEHGGWPIACGLGVLTHDLLGLFDLFTAEAHRRKGNATAVLDYILAWGFERGATSAFLQVHSENSTAQSLYRGFGFDVAYPYWYRIERRNPDPPAE